MHSLIGPRDLRIIRLRAYPTLRSLHLYLGLFVSPFVVVFAASVIFLVHSWLPGSKASATTRTVANVAIPETAETAKGREQVVALRPVLDGLGVRGEIGFIRYVPRDRRITMPVTQPGRQTTVELRLAERAATITESRTGIADAMTYLHKMPGPHNVNIRGNSPHVTAWRWFADGTVYLLLLVSATGIYLWAVLKAERRIGLGLLAAGALSMGGVIYALIA
jgi:hypothetical protein